MYKYLPKLSVFLTAVAALPVYLLPATAETKCLNYWVNPATGKEECLNLSVTKKSGFAAEKTTDIPEGFEFLTKSDQGENLFIQVPQASQFNGVVTSFPTVVRKKFKGKFYDTKYRVKCDERLVYITASSDFAVNKLMPLAVHEPGTLGHKIWNRSCHNFLFPASTTNGTNYRVVPSRCGEYRIKRRVDEDNVKPRRLNPYSLRNGGYLSGFSGNKRGHHRGLINSQNLIQNHDNFNPVQPQFSSQFHDIYQTSGRYQLQGCQGDYRHYSK
jgi:hypothetical protein